MKIELLAIIGALLCSAPGCTEKMARYGHLRPLETPTPGEPTGTVAQQPAGLVEAARPAQPGRITHALLARGREQYEISCLPCHGPAGYGDGMVVQRGFLAPPSYHTDRLRNAPDRHFYDVITEGFGAMYSYADRVEESDRWAVTAYIRALQLSQNSRAAGLSPEDRALLPKEGEP